MSPAALVSQRGGCQLTQSRYARETDRGRKRSVECVGRRNIGGSTLKNRRAQRAKIDWTEMHQPSLPLGDDRTFVGGYSPCPADRPASKRTIHAQEDDICVGR